MGGKDIDSLTPIRELSQSEKKASPQKNGEALVKIVSVVSSEVKAKEEAEALRRIDGVQRGAQGGQCWRCSGTHEATDCPTIKTVAVPVH